MFKKNGISKRISWLNSSFLEGDDRNLLKAGVLTYLIARMLPLNSPTFFFFHIYSLWITHANLNTLISHVKARRFPLLIRLQRSSSVQKNIRLQRSSSVQKKHLSEKGHLKHPTTTPGQQELRYSSPSRGRFSWEDPRDERHVNCRDSHQRDPHPSSSKLHFTRLSFILSTQMTEKDIDLLKESILGGEGEVMCSK